MSKSNRGAKSGMAQRSGAATGAKKAATPPPAAERSVAGQIRARTQGQRPVNTNRYAVREPGWRKQLPLISVVGGVVVLIAVFIFIAHQASGGNATGNVDPTVLNAVTTVSPTVSDSVGTGNLKSPIKGMPPGAPPLTANGHPEFLYVGAEYCPYCAAERWSMVVALSRFGTFSGLGTTTSSSTDTYPDTSTFTFHGSTYTSKYLTFTPVEIQDRDGNALEKLSGQPLAIFQKYDYPPYATDQGGIPFISIGDKYTTLSSGFSPQLLQGLTWSDIAGKLKDPKDPITQAIVGNANYLTAAICSLTNGQPSGVCASPTIQGIEAQLPKGS